MGAPLELLTYHSDVFLEIGTQVSVTLGKREMKGVLIEAVEKPEFKTQVIIEDLPFIFSRTQIQMAQFMAEYYGCSVGEALNLCVPYEKEVHISQLIPNTIPADITLSSTQEEALNFIRSHPVSLLFGDTGAGKSEIYMKRMDEILNEGMKALLLLPEISLTPQMEERFKHHFGESFVLWHSKMTPKQKKVTLEKIYDGSARIVAGPRSALFLPLQDLGIIVVDEEHDESYKSSSRPRYHARDMAIYMGKMLNIPVVLGSATPSLSSYAKYPYFRLRGGYYTSKRTFVFEPSVEALTPSIDAAIIKNYHSNHQGIVFIPTRANFKYMMCDGCGYTIECPFCSVGMSLHRNAKALKCHYCNYTEVLPRLGPKCQSSKLTNARLGTAEAVEHLATIADGMKVAQFDRDVITTQNKLIKTLKAFCITQGYSGSGNMYCKLTHFRKIDLLGDYTPQIIN